MNIILPDGSTKNIADGSTALDLAKALSISLAREAIAAKVNNVLVDLSAPLHENDSVAIVTFDSAEGKSVFWHSSSHLMAQAVQELFPGTKIAIGPSIDNGFYYDFDFEKPISPEDLKKIEDRCREIVVEKNSDRAAGRRQKRMQAPTSRKKTSRTSSNCWPTWKASLHLPSGRVAGPVPRAACARHRPYQGDKNFKHRGRLLAGQRKKQDAYPALRHLVPETVDA